MPEDDGASAGDMGGEAPGMSDHMVVPLEGLTPERGREVVDHLYADLMARREREAAGDVRLPGLLPEAEAARRARVLEACAAASAEVVVAREREGRALELERRALEAEGERPFRGATYLCDPYGEPSWWEREGLNLAFMLTMGVAAGLAVVLLLTGSSLPGWVRAACALAASGAAMFGLRLKLGGHR